jgi:ParB/RepB/Spo0J family partition protein
MENFVDIQTVDINEIVPNNWNPNEQDEITFNELVYDIDSEGFDEPIQVVELSENDPERQEGRRYRIIGGEHRFEAVKTLGWKKIPIVVKDYDTEDEQKIKTVRRNMLKGHMNRYKFTQLVNSLDGRRQDSELAIELGLKSKEELQTLLINEKGDYDPELAEQIANVRREETAIKNLSMILNKLFAEYGETLSHSYMFFTYGTKLHVMIMMSRILQKKMDSLSIHCNEKDKDINEILEKIIQFGWDAYLKNQI